MDEESGVEEVMSEADYDNLSEIEKLELMSAMAEKIRILSKACESAYRCIIADDYSPEARQMVLKILKGATDGA